MKKIVALLLAVLICLGCFSASAAVSFNVGDYTTDELITIRALIISELMFRQIDKKIDVPQGRYVVGVDIPSGFYTVATDNFIISLTIHSNRYSNDYAFTYVVTDTEKVGKLELKNGNAIEVVGGTITLTPYQGLSFN